MFKRVHYVRLSMILLCLYACEGESKNEQDSSAVNTEGPTAGEEEPAAGAEEPSVGGEEPSVGGEEPSGAGEEPSGGTGGTQEPPVEPERPTLPEGRGDQFSTQACQMLDLEVTPVIAVAEPSEAGQVTLLPDEMRAYSVRLPESGQGYFTLEVPDWATTVALFTHYSQRVEVDSAGDEVEVDRPLSWNTSCDGITDERFHFHSWGSYLVALRGEPNSDIKVAVLKTE